MILPVLFLLFAPDAPAPETAESIMAKVAANQDRSEALRTQYVYHQKVLVRVQGGNGKLMREERQAYTVSPTPDGFHRDLLETVVAPEKARQVDCEIAHEFANDLVGDKKSRDGIDHDLFPLTAKQQQNYRFHLVGSETYRDRPVYHVSFEPLPNHDSDWKGDALIDVKEFQPVLVTTELAWGIPRAVRIIFGTNVQNLGFKVTYSSFDGQWFPETYSGEMKIKALYLFQRRIGISMVNTEFKRSDVSAKITYQEP